jgi:hypothetical protein
MHLLHKFKVSDLFTQDIQGAQRTFSYRGIEFAHIGMRIQVNGKMGTICGTNSSCNLDVCFDGNNFVTNCHPNYKTKYYDKAGSLILDTSVCEEGSKCKTT